MAGMAQVGFTFVIDQCGYEGVVGMNDNHRAKIVIFYPCKKYLVSIKSVRRNMSPTHAGIISKATGVSQR
jgi:hypothetical protein